VLTIGAIGLMILAMISRVSLGHTGRQLKAHWLMGIAFFAIFVTTIIRFVGSEIFHEYISEALFMAGLFWVLGFGLFFLIYLPILTTPRVDGRPG
jgi:uncharacterized protein involved in response to NO